MSMDFLIIGRPEPPPGPDVVCPGLTEALTSTLSALTVVMFVDATQTERAKLYAAAQRVRRTIPNCILRVRSLSIDHRPLMLWLDTEESSDEQ